MGVEKKSLQLLKSTTRSMTMIYQKIANCLRATSAFSSNGACHVNHIFVYVCLVPKKCMHLLIAVRCRERRQSTQRVFHPDAYACEVIKLGSSSISHSPPLPSLSYPLSPIFFVTCTIAKIYAHS